jgi:hypothetical protein
VLLVVLLAAHFVMFVGVRDRRQWRHGDQQREGQGSSELHAGLLAWGPSATAEGQEA